MLARMHTSWRQNGARQVPVQTGGSKQQQAAEAAAATATAAAAATE